MTTDTVAPYETSVDLSNSPRKYAYFYAKAYDGYVSTPVISGFSSQPYAQAGYSRVIELGPEVILAGQQLPPTPPPPLTPGTLPIASSFDQLHLFLDEVEKVILTGSNLTGTFNVDFLQQGGTAKLPFTSITGGGDKLELDFTTKDLTALPLGQYSVQVTRTSDSLTLAHPKTFVFTRLGDLWRSGATDLDEEPRDGKVDLSDVSRLLTRFGKSSGQSGFDPEADINGPQGIPDGKTDLFDANKLMANWRP